MSKKDDTKEIKQQVWTYYKIGPSGISRLKKECPRCKASFLAEHKDRRTCGKCGYTEFKSSKSTKAKA